MATRTRWVWRRDCDSPAFARACKPTPQPRHREPRATRPGSFVSREEVHRGAAGPARSRDVRRPRGRLAARAGLGGAAVRRLDARGPVPRARRRRPRRAARVGGTIRAVGAVLLRRGRSRRAIVVGDRDGLRVTDVARELPIESATGPPRRGLDRDRAVAPGPSHARPAPAHRRPHGLPRVRGRRAARRPPGARSVVGAGARRSACWSIDRAVVFDHWKQRLLLVAHVPAGGYDDGVAAAARARRARRGAPSPADLAPMPGGAAPSSTGEPNMPDERYREIVASFKEHILAGDIFQGGAVAPRDVPRARRRLRRSIAGSGSRTPPRTCSSCACWASSSPGPRPSRWCAWRERVSRRGRSRARVRAATTEARDRRLEHELLADPKERAEHAMLVDLARNDLGRVCVAGSVEPTQLMEVERFTKVMHIVSTVEGDLRDDLHPFDALAVTFPAGTLSGAPEATGDGADRLARARRARPLRRRRRLLHVPGRPRLLHHDPNGGREGRQRPPAIGGRRRRRFRPTDRARRDEGEGLRPAAGRRARHRRAGSLDDEEVPR